MPARQQGLRPLYGVHLTKYASDAIKRAVERGADRIHSSEQLATETFYIGTSKAQAERALARAVLAGYTDPLGLEVTIRRDHIVLARVKMERD